MKVPFNIPYLPASVSNLNLQSPDLLRTQGKFYQACKKEIKKQLGFGEVILTPSCTSALELIALTLNIKPGDEVIVPSYTYVSTANAFALRGAKLIFVDTYRNHPSIDLKKIEQAITKNTKAIVIVHYGGIAIDYSLLKKIKTKYSIPIVEDAAHCFGAKSNNMFIGSIGDFSAFSFHETKNISCGQGGAAVINNPKYLDAINSISQCGTNKIDFIKQKVNFYSWKSLGSNFLLAEPLCAILLASLKMMKKINKKRVEISKTYNQGFIELEKKELVELPPITPTGNGHIFYILTKNLKERNGLIQFLKLKNIEATFHYYPLHLSSFGKKSAPQKSLKNTEFISDRIIRLPLYYTLKSNEQQHVISSVCQFYGK